MQDFLYQQDLTQIALDITSHQEQRQAWLGLHLDNASDVLCADAQKIGQVGSNRWKHYGFGFQRSPRHSVFAQMQQRFSGQIIATSQDLTPKGS